MSFPIYYVRMTFEKNMLSEFMVDDATLARKSYELIKRDFGLDEEFSAEGDDQLAHLHRFLTTIIDYLLEKDFARLMNSLYRIDVSEEQVKMILKLSEPDQMASDLSTAIIRRELKKVRTRMQYQNQERASNSNDFN